jgi:glycosyltransferase involved in cell wall biosynthesis
MVTVGRLTRQKGYPHLLAALTFMPAEQRPLTLFVGDGPDRAELEARATALGLARDVRFLGNRHDVPALLAAADLFVLSSLWEGLPLALLEAMAAGLPPIVTTVGGNVEVIEHGKSCILVPAANEQALANALTCLLHDPLRREQIGRAARERFEQRYSLESFIKAHECLYEDLLIKRSKPKKMAA